MRSIILFVLILAGLLPASVTAQLECPPPSCVNAFIPAFEGPQPLAQNVANILTLQLWRTLRKAPTPNPKKLEFGSGQVTPGERLSKQSSVVAEMAARDLDAQMTLWGYAENYGNGVVAQAYLSLPNYEDHRHRRPEFWRLRLADSDIVADLPRRQFEITPIVLRSQLVQRYSSPTALQLCPEKREPCKGSPLGNVGFRAYNHEGTWSYIVTSDHRKGWMNLPGLSESPNEIIDFTGAIISIYRGDWDQANRLLARVLATPSLRSSIAVDALLLRTMVAEQSGKSGLEFTERALAANPYSRVAIQYRVMVDISQATRSTSQSSNHSLAATAIFLNERRQLFLPEDPWLLAVTRAFRALGLPTS